MTQRVTADDLELAATWLEAYEAGPDDEAGDTMARVAAWLRTEVQRRADEAIVRNVARRTGATTTRVRAALRRTQQQRPA